MKISNVFLVVLSLSLAATAGFAEEAPSKRPWLGPKADLNKDGKIGVEEAQQAEEVWKQTHREKIEEKKEEQKENREEKREEFKDNNPPGPRGGEGTNWENKPGPQGGPGAGPDRGMRMDRDNNPPGMAGGPGSNWENKPGPQGGPGASPNRGPQGMGQQGGGQKQASPQGGPRKQN